MNEFKIEFSMEIVGGPHDGQRGVYRGTADTDDVLETMDKINFDKHVYKIVEFDKEKNHAVLMW